MDEFLCVLSCVVTVNLNIHYIILINFSLSLSLSEDQVGNDVSHEILSSSPTKINGGTNETLTSTNLSLSPQINQHDEMDGTYQPHGSDGDDNDSKEVLKKEDVAYDEHREQIKMIMSSYTDSEDS